MPKFKKKIADTHNCSEIKQDDNKATTSECYAITLDIVHFFGQEFLQTSYIFSIILNIKPRKLRAKFC